MVTCLILVKLVFSLLDRAPAVEMVEAQTPDTIVAFHHIANVEALEDVD